MKNPTARELAAEILVSVEKNGAYSSLALNDALKNVELKEARDKNLVSSLVYAVIEHRLTIDLCLSSFLKQPLKKLHPMVLTLLRLGAVQILYFDKIPASAAVNESVNIAKKKHLGYAAGMINAVLRRVAKDGLTLPDGNGVDALSVRYSYPKELCSLFAEQFGNDEAERIFRTYEGRRPIFIRVNTLKTDEETLIKTLEESNVAVGRTTLANCLQIKNFGDITSIDAFKDGYFYVQDMSSQTCAAVLGAEPGDYVIDCCAAPGGKSFTTAMYMKNCGRIVSGDIHEHKAELIKKTAERLGISCIETYVGDAAKMPDEFKGADKILCDVPCSGFGVIGRKPEIKYKDLSEVAALPEIQYAILSHCSTLLKKGGRLVYSTCTLNRAENREVCERFLSEHNDFSVSTHDTYKNLCGENEFAEILPTENGGDGFFIASFERISE